jgi:uncharacterized protein YkwD
MIRPRFSRTSLPLVACCALGLASLSSCGGGVETKGSSSAAQLAPNLSPTLDGDEALDAEEQAFLGLINTYRAQNGLGPLAVSPAMTRAAAWMSADMASKNYFSHTDSLGRSAFVRLAAFGYAASTMAENVAAGNAGAQATFNQWKASPGHNANMLHAGVSAIGIGRAYDASSSFGWYWTTDFGSSATP